MSEKTCRDCGETKDLEDFARRNDTPDGRYRQCKTCLRAQRASGRRVVAPSGAIVAPPEAPANPVQTTTAATDYVAPKDVLATWAAVQMMARDGELPPNLYFTGPSGSGKTECARHLAALAGLPFFQVDTPAMTDPETWFGTREVVVEDGASKTVYHESEFVRALQQPCVLLVDEASRASDAIRNILLSLLDDSRRATNPLTGEVILRHPLCFVVLTANVGLAFTGTYAVDVAFSTRALTSEFAYLDSAQETRLAVSRTGCSLEAAALFVRFANETRQRAASDPDFTPISTREVLAACRLARRGLDLTTAARQSIITARSNEGGGDSARAALEMIWTGVRPTA